MKKKLAITLAACLTAATAFSFTACGGNSNKDFGDTEKGDRTEISFLCAPNNVSTKAWENLIAAYNDGQGVKDNVYVSASFKGSLTPSQSVFTRSKERADNVVALSDSQDAFQSLAIKRDKSKAPNGYFVNLTPYAEKDEDFKNGTIPENVLNWWRMTYNSEAKQGAGQQKHVIGAGQNLLGVPYGTNAHFNWYNKAIFKAQNINIVSVPEEELEDYNTANNATLKPHGYAEYKTAPAQNMTASKNLAGQTVYKVFNNCIGMNWEEQRNFLKYFTPEYNDGKVTEMAATTKFGFVSEYWFNYGWSVGGDVMGFNGTDYDFTLLDKSANYLVTKDGVKVNGNTYNAGEIVRYEDRVKQSDIATMDGVYAIESQYNAVKEYVSLQVASDVTVDSYDGKTYKGYGVASPDTTTADNKFNTAEIAMVRGTPESVNAKKESKSWENFDMCVPETYREYEGGSVYYSGNVEDYAHEYLKVIGETYGGKVYTGEIKKVDGTPVIGNTTSASISQGLVIPTCSDPEKYQAAWDFISWVATDGQKYIAQTKTVAPVAEKTLFSADYVDNAEITNGRNYYAIAKTSLSAGRGDWGYFENGQWVTNWSSDFNNEVRKGNQTLTDFLKAHGAGGKSDLNNMYCVIKGIR